MSAGKTVVTQVANRDGHSETVAVPINHQSEVSKSCRMIFFIF